MRIAVTGASGFIGGAVVVALRARGYDVQPFGRRAARELRRPIAGYECWDVATGARALDVDAVVHCAAQVAQWGARESFWRTNVLGTQRVVDSMPPSARLVYVSTASVYPTTSHDRPIAEDASEGARPASAYGQSKLAGERVALERGKSTTVLRPHVVYGTGDTTLWPRIESACRNGRITIPGNGRNRLSVTHIDNLIAAVIAALRPAASTGVFNIADAEVPTVDELLRTMFARRGMPTAVRYVPRPLASSVAAAIEGYWRATARRTEPPLTRYAVNSLAHHSVLDTTRAQTQLGYVPQRTYRDGPL